jgi:hypothetical protein
LLGSARNQINHIFDFRLGDYLGRELRIDQNDIGADRLHSPYTVADQKGGFRMFITSKYGVGAYLPEHQVWTLSGDTLVEAGEHVDGTSAADATV